MAPGLVDGGTENQSEVSDSRQGECLKNTYDECDRYACQEKALRYLDLGFIAQEKGQTPEEQVGEDDTREEVSSVAPWSDRPVERQCGKPNENQHTLQRVSVSLAPGHKDCPRLLPGWSGHRRPHRPGHRRSGARYRRRQDQPRGSSRILCAALHSRPR